MTEATNGSRPVRAVVLWAFAVVLVVLLMAIAAALAVLADNAQAERERACRSRIVAHAEGIRDARDSAGWDALADRVLQGQQIDTQARARQIDDLNAALAGASDLRRRADDVCAQDPAFIPPT